MSDDLYQVAVLMTAYQGHTDDPGPRVTRWQVVFDLMNPPWKKYPVGVPYTTEYADVAVAAKKKAANARFDEISDKYYDNQDALAYFASLAIGYDDLSGKYIVEVCNRYFPGIKEPLVLWADAKEQVALLDVIWGQWP